MKRNPLLDNDFLIELDHYYEKEKWAKIIALDINENPVEEITGRVTGGGSINVDGTSAVRRACSLSMVAKDVNINDFYWGLHTKFKLYIGLSNKINPEYPDIIWFPQGVYLITSFNTSHSTNNYTISIQGKDKMCLLNGEIGGTLTAPIDFGKLEERDEEGNLTITDIPIKDIIREGVHEYAKEPWHNIIVNDLEDLGIELLEYKGSRPLYMIINENTHEVTNMTMNESFQLYNGATRKTIATIVLENGLNKLTEFYPGMTTGYFTGTLEANGTGPKYSIAKVEYGQTAGYRLTDLTYPGDLIASVGDPLTSILDKLVQMLGQFEYFYDIDGRFVFQKKKLYIQTTWNNLLTTDEGDVIADIDATPYGYEFKGNDLTIAFSNNPNLGNLKNDFSIWGTRTSVTGAEIPVHLRYAIDKKPLYYKAMDGKVYVSDLSIYEREKEIAKEEIITEVGAQIMGFQMTHGLGDTKLAAPTKNEDGSWTPGWWNIEDWYEFYFLLKQEYPNKTMKWYSQNTVEGAPLVSTIPDIETKVTNQNYLKPNNRCWLIIQRADGKYNLQHGTSDRTDSRLCTCYYSYIDENGVTKTQVDPNEPKQNFRYPYAGCSDNHTYLEFIKSDVSAGNTVYFYNPKFPAVESFKEMVTQKIEKEFEELMNSGQLQLCDWREIIYQMAKDYRKHNHDDDFLVKLRDNNFLYNEYLYPDGYTGYEQYYIDLEGFWRQLYNPNYVIDDKKLNLGGDGPFETGIELNEFGQFNGVNIEDIFVYPIKPIDDITEVLKDSDGNDVEEDVGNNQKRKVLRYSPEEALLLEEGSPYNIADFTKTINIVDDEKYFIKYSNEEKPKAVSKEIAELAAITSILIKPEQEDNSTWSQIVYLNENFSKQWIFDNDYVRLVDYEYISATTYGTLYYQSNKAEKVLSLKDTDYSGVYFKDKTNNILWQSYFSKENIVDSEEFYYKQTKINFYYITYNYYGSEEPDKQYWNKNVWDSPQSLNFWFDFMDTQGELNNYAVSVVGNRPKVVNDSSIKSIYFRETPTVIFINKNNHDGWDFTERKSGYTYIQLPDSMLSLFSMSGQGKSAWNMLEECMYNDTYCIESASITTIPIYYLQPNTKVYIRDDDSKIDGEYNVSRFTIPLNYNGTMSISATKIAERIY